MKRDTYSRIAIIKRDVVINPNCSLDKTRHSRESGNPDDKKTPQNGSTSWFCQRRWYGFRPAQE